MIGSGRVIGIILFAVGGIILCGCTAWIGAAVAQQGLSLDGAALGLVVGGVIPFAILGGAGAFLFMRGRAEMAETAIIRKKERLLGLIQAQGKVSLGAVMVELGLSREQVTEYVYELVSQGLFSGYIDWKDATFYGAEAGDLDSGKCPNCGGVREVVGKGVVACPYCGVQLFIRPTAAR